MLKATSSFHVKELLYNTPMKTAIKILPYVIGAYGLINIIVSFFTHNWWQGITGVWMIIAAPIFKPENLICPSANCCQNRMEDEMEGKNNG